MTATQHDEAAEPLSKQDFEALAEFRFGIRRYLRFSEETVRDHGITPQQYQLMLALKGAPGRDWATVQELADRLRLRHHSVVGLVNRAQQQDLVSRAPNPSDARAVRVGLSQHGEQLLARLSAAHRDELQRMGSAFAPPAWDDSRLGLCDRIVGETQEAVIYTDRDGLIEFWNSGAEVLFGFSESEAVGRSLDLIIPEKLRKRHWDGWQRVIETGETKYGQEPLAVPGMRADGSRVSLEFSITMLRDAAGQITGIAAILRDVTQRWEQDRALRKRLAAAEAQLQSAEAVTATS